MQKYFHLFIHLSFSLQSETSVIEITDKKVFIFFFFLEYYDSKVARSLLTSYSPTAEGKVEDERTSSAEQL